MSTQTFQAFFVLFVMGVAVGCGGKVVFEESGSGGAGSSVATTSSVTSKATSTTGGCDDASHTVHIEDYDVSCNTKSDCFSVYIGSFCSQCLCQNAAINVADKQQYYTDIQGDQVPPQPGGCFCPAAPVDCIFGKCAVVTP